MSPLSQTIIPTITKGEDDFFKQDTEKWRTPQVESPNKRLRNENTVSPMILRMDQDDRLSIIMTPPQNSTIGDIENPSEVQNSSHYHRFKRHSTGYQSQGAHLYGYSQF